MKLDRISFKVLDDEDVFKDAVLEVTETRRKQVQQLVNKVNLLHLLKVIVVIKHIYHHSVLFPRGVRRRHVAEAPAPPAPRHRQTLEGSFSAVSKPNFASKYVFESSRRDLHNALQYLDK